jgi:hypothetical protein
MHAAKFFARVARKSSQELGTQTEGVREIAVKYDRELLGRHN